jgi:hypothetical protein
MSPFDDLDPEKAGAARLAFEAATRALAAVKGAHLPGARKDYEHAIEAAIRYAVEAGDADREAILKAAIQAIVSGPTQRTSK